MREGSLALTDAELYDVTRKRRPSAQVRALRFMGIDHRVRPDNTVCVLHEALAFANVATPKRRATG